MADLSIPLASAGVAGHITFIPGVLAAKFSGVWEWVAPTLVPPLAGPLNTIGTLILFLPGTSVMVRRFHDINKSGWNYFWCLTVIGIIPIIYWLYFKEGDNGENFYGSNILYETSEDKKNDIDFDAISKLEKLAKLKEQGHITEEEYNVKKKELL